MSVEDLSTEDLSTVPLNRGDFRSLTSCVVKNELGIAVNGTGV